MLASQTLGIRAEEKKRIWRQPDVEGRVQPRGSQEVLGADPGSASGSVLPGVSLLTSLHRDAWMRKQRKGLKVPFSSNSLQMFVNICVLRLFGCK